VTEECRRLAGIWCFIRDPYAGPRVWLHYLPLYIVRGSYLLRIYASHHYSLSLHYWSSTSLCSGNSAIGSVRHNEAARSARLNVQPESTLSWPRILASARTITKWQTSSCGEWDVGGGSWLREAL